MGITSTFEHTLDPEFEQYSFPSKVNPKQRHFIDIDRGEDYWKLGIVQLEESLSLEEVQELRVELAELYAFMVSLKSRDLRRITEPGEPDHHGVGGGL